MEKLKKLEKLKEALNSNYKKMLTPINLELDTVSMHLVAKVQVFSINDVNAINRVAKAERMSVLYMVDKIGCGADEMRLIVWLSAVHND